MIRLRQQEAQIADLKNVSAGWQREIQRLNQQRSAAALRIAETDAARLVTGTSDDSAFDARMRALVENVNRLKKLLDQTPAAQIPELRFLRERDWFNVAQRFPNLGAGADSRAAFAALRNAAKHRFLPLMKAALDEYLKTSGGVLPPEVTQLARHFDPPVEATLLQRYEMLASGHVSAVPQVGRLLQEKAAQAIDPRYDNLAGLSGHGTTMAGVPGAGIEPPATPDSAELRKAVDRALRAYEAAHDGDVPNFDQIEKLLPYFEKPEDGAQFAQQMKQAQARMMPSALNQALNEARRAYQLTHHGAEPTDQMELASYFQKPEDGARYLEFITRNTGAKSR